VEPLPQFAQGRPFGTAADLREEIIREGEAFQRRTRFEEAVQLVRNITELDHLCHVKNIHACFPHVKSNMMGRVVYLHAVDKYRRLTHHPS
jgi:hypothetical protein